MSPKVTQLMSELSTTASPTIAEQQAAEEVEQKDKLEKEVMTSRVQEV
jgi:hypothetical protein